MLKTQICVTRPQCLNIMEYRMYPSFLFLSASHYVNNKVNTSVAMACRPIWKRSINLKNRTSSCNIKCGNNLWNSCRVMSAVKGDLTTAWSISISDTRQVSHVVGSVAAPVYPNCVRIRLDALYLHDKPFINMFNCTLPFCSNMFRSLMWPLSGYFITRMQS